MTATRHKVLLSPYTIPDVVKMVLFAGGTPVFIDHLARSTQVDVSRLEAAVDDQTACVMVTHYHVNQSSIEEISSICKRKGAALVEDCAISLGGTIGGKSVGTQYTGGVFSLSSYKFLNFFWGGALFAADQHLQDQIGEEVQKWRRFRPHGYASQVLRTLKYDLATRPVFFDCFTAPLLRWKQRRSSKAQTLQPPRIESETFDDTFCTRPGSAAFAEWNRKLGRVRDQREHRRQIAAIYDRHFGELMVSAPVAPEVFAGSCFVNYPIWVGAPVRDAIYKRMLLDRFDIGLSLYPNVHEHPTFRSLAGESAEVASLCASVLSLPTHPRVTVGYAEALASHLRSIL